MNLLIPQPILFHPLKHHLGYLKQLIDFFVGLDAGTKEVLPLLRTIGNSQMDLYHGYLSPEAIAQEVIHTLNEQKLLLPAAYHSYLEKGHGFQLIHLSDDTAWVLRWGEIQGRHIHIHPGRYALHTIRVKATALKTAVAALIFARKEGQIVPDLALLNMVRQQYLGLSPSKTLDFEKGAGRLIQLLL